MHRRGYVSRSMMTRLILETHPWSHVDITLVFICAMPMAMASPLVVIMTTCSQQPARASALTTTSLIDGHMEGRSDLARRFERMTQLRNEAVAGCGEREDIPQKLLANGRSFGASVKTNNIRIKMPRNSENVCYHSNRQHRSPPPPPCFFMNITFCPIRLHLSSSRDTTPPRPVSQSSSVQQHGDALPRRRLRCGSHSAGGQGS